MPKACAVLALLVRSTNIPELGCVSMIQSSPVVDTLQGVLLPLPRTLLGRLNDRCNNSVVVRQTLGELLDLKTVVVYQCLCTCITNIRLLLLIVLVRMELLYCPLLFH